MQRWYSVRRYAATMASMNPVIPLHTESGWPLSCGFPVHLAPTASTWRFHFYRPGWTTLPTLAVDSQNDVCSHLSDYIVVTVRVVAGVYEHHWIDVTQGSFLLSIDLGKKIVRQIRDEALDCFKTIDIHERFGSLPGGHSFCIHRDDLLIEFTNILLLFFHRLWLEGRFPLL